MYLDREEEVLGAGERLALQEHVLDEPILHLLWPEPDKRIGQLDGFVHDHLVNEMVRDTLRW